LAPTLLTKNRDYLLMRNSAVYWRQRAASRRVMV
jgi:hypothetical protein